MISDCISDDISPKMKILNMVIPILMHNALLQFYLKFERYKPLKAACHLTKCDVINEVKLFPTAYHRIYCCKFLMLSNQTPRYKSKCIRIPS